MEKVSSRSDSVHGSGGYVVGIMEVMEQPLHSPSASTRTSTLTPPPPPPSAHAGCRERSSRSIIAYYAVIRKTCRLRVAGIAQSYGVLEGGVAGGPEAPAVVVHIYVHLPGL